MKYHLGCGSRYLEGYVNVDFPRERHTVNETVRADMYADILTMNYESCEEIRLHHVFEHFGFVDSFKLIKKWTAALTVPGKLVVDVPDVEGLAQAILDGSISQKFRAIRYLYGSQEAGWAYHINGWTADMLVHVLRNVGYSCTTVEDYGNPNDECPNCGVCVTGWKTWYVTAEEVHERLSEMLSLYANGDTPFENRLTEYWRGQLRE